MWVNENWRTFAYRHIIGLINLVLNSPSIMHMASTSKRFKEAVAVTDCLYEIDKEREREKEKEKEKEKEREEGGNKILSSMFNKPVSFPRPLSAVVTRTASTDEMVISTDKEKEKEKEPKKLSSRIAHHFGMSNTGG